MLIQEKAGTRIGIPAFRKGKKAVLIPATTKGGEGELANSINYSTQKRISLNVAICRITQQWTGSPADCNSNNQENDQAEDHLHNELELRILPVEGIS